MHASIHALLERIVDYAGLFPPAKLPLDAALGNYLHERKMSPYRWMLGRFVCPADRLTELLALTRGHEDAELLHVSALGRQAASPGDFLGQLQADVQAIREFRQAIGNDRVIDQYEVALPEGGAFAQLPEAARILQATGAAGFFEVARTASWRDDVARIAGAIPPDFHGLKLRTGGVTAEAFPRDDEVAHFIARCRDARLMWKATAGLHHPRRHRDALLNVWHHGFVNVFCAGLLALVHPLTEADLAAILADRDAAHFRFEPADISWQAWSMTSAQIAALRPKGATTFGSCSFAEPCADLRAMGLLD